METPPKTSGESWGIVANRALWLLWGILLGAAKLIYSFIPLFNILDIIIFGFIGYLIARRYKAGHYFRLLLAILPALAITGWISTNLNLQNVMQGIGTGWILSLLIIPLAAFIGKRLGTASVRAEQAT